MNTIQNKNSMLIEELEKSVDQKIVLLQCLDVIYTNAMELLEKQEFEKFLEKIEDQQLIADSVDGIEAQIEEICGRYPDKSEVKALINGNAKETECPPELKKLAGKIETSGKILSSCITLNEKLTYRANEEKSNIVKNIATAKNRRLIKLNYGKNGTSKMNVNIILDC